MSLDAGIYFAVNVDGDQSTKANYDAIANVQSPDPKHPYTCYKIVEESGKAKWRIYSKEDFQGTDSEESGATGFTEFNGGVIKSVQGFNVEEFTCALWPQTKYQGVIHTVYTKTSSLPRPMISGSIIGKWEIFSEDNYKGDHTTVANQEYDNFKFPVKSVKPRK